MDGALGHEGVLQALRKGRQGLRRIGCTDKGRAAQGLEDFEFLRFELYWGVPLKHVRTQGDNLQAHGLHLQCVVTAFEPWRASLDFIYGASHRASVKRPW